MCYNRFRKRNQGGDIVSFNYRKLKGRIVEKYGTQDKFAQELGITPNTLSLKLNGKGEFSQGEIAKMSDILLIKKQDIPTYFFTQKV